MKIRVITEQNMNTREWSGGKTTEMLIYPGKASYTERDFRFRISSATVEEESSTFTDLPGIERHLVVLDGEIDLQIEKQSFHLAAFESIVFQGEDKTSSKGKCTDFNLMLNGCRGNLEVFTIDGNKNVAVNPNEMCMFYTYESSLEIKKEKEVFDVPKKGLLVAENDMLTVENITLSAKKGARIIGVRIQI